LDYGKEAKKKVLKGRKENKGVWRGERCDESCEDEIDSERKNDYFLAFQYCCKE